MGFVDNDSESFILQAANAIYYVGELLDSGSDNLGVTSQSLSKVGRITLVIHYTDESRLVFDSHNCLLQLPIHYYTISTDNCVIKDNFIICVMKRGQAMSQPSSFIGLA